MYVKLNSSGGIEYPPHNDKTLMNCHLNEAWLAEHGFENHPEAWFKEHESAVPEVPHRYSTLKLHDGVGHETWQRILATLSEEERTRLALAQELSTDDAQFQAAITTLKTTIPNAEAILAAAEII